MSVLNPADEFAFNARVRELFTDLQHAGSLPVDGVSAGSIEQGAAVQLFVEAQAGRVHAVRYQAYGCPHFLSACELMARWLEGRAVAELAGWRWRDLETELSMPASKRARLLLLDDALQAAIRRLG